MLIKSADDKSKRLKLLEDLQSSPRLDDEQKKWLNKELWALREGMQGEKDAAHYINAHYADSPNWAVLHDVRIVVDGDVAQIDHLLIGRTLVFLLETKNFNGNVHINAHGEFTVSYASGKRMGIPSPLEQSMRHEKILHKLLQRLDIRSRTGGALPCHHIVMFHPKAIIERPDARQFDTRNIIKADALRSWHDRFAQEDVGFLKAMTLVTQMRSQATVREWAEKIARQHRPQDLLALPDFMQPKTPAAPVFSAMPAAPTRTITKPTIAPASLSPAALHPPLPVCATCGQPISAAEARYCRSHAQRFNGALYCRQHQAAFPAPAKCPGPAPQQPSPARHAAAAERPLVCATCGVAISPAEGHFCWRQPQRFGGQQYCREHQAAFPR